MQEKRIVKANIEDACSIIEFMNLAGGESDNLSFGKGEFNIAVEQEQEFITSINHSHHSILLICKINNVIIAIGSLNGNERPRTSHRAEISITVKKSHWNLGIGSDMMKALINFGKEDAHIKVIQLEVRTDNENAIYLYEKLGFKKIGMYEMFYKINNQYFDAYLMNLIL